MKNKVVVALLVLMLLIVGVTVASAAEWDCFPAGPVNNIHCFPPGKALLLSQGKAPRSLQAQVFHFDTGEYLGTEQLLHEDIYNWQPCPQDGHETWDFLGEEFPYYACHHYETGFDD